MLIHISPDQISGHWIMTGIFFNITLANFGYLFLPDPEAWPTRGMVSRSVNQNISPHFPTQPKLQLGFTTKLVGASRMARGEPW